MKVIAFDSWTEGASHLTRLVDAFESCGLELMLIHVGSWGHDPARPAEERIGPLRVRDIRYYGRAGFRQILERERPAAVLFLSLQAFAHRAFNRYRRHLGIPALHLYHGLVTVQDTASARLNPVSVPRQLALSMERAPKNIGRLLPVYARSLLETGAGSEDWMWLARDVWRKIAGRSYSGPAAPDAVTDACCVYTRADMAHAVERYHVRPDAVFPVGNPDLIAMNLSEADLGVCVEAPRGDPRTIVYIDTALVDVGAVFDGRDQFIAHMLMTRDAVAGAGYRLVVKLHPAHGRTNVPERLREADVALCDNHEFVPLLRRSAAAIVEPSSAALIPALLGVPILLARYGRLAPQTYGSVLTAYPRARSLRSEKDVNTCVIDAWQSSQRDVLRWIESNAGPLPAAEMPLRVARVCADLAQHRMPGRAA